MAIFEEQRICINATETYELIKEAFGDADLSRSRTFEWFSRFQKGREKIITLRGKQAQNQWIERGEPKPKKADLQNPKSRHCLLHFFDINGLVHYEFIPFGRTINQEVYLGIMRRLREAVRLKRPERWQNNDWILHVDNAQPHTAHVVLQFLAKHSTIQIPHPPYSPDLAPNDFFLYPKLKMKLKGRKFDNVDMIQAESKATLRNLSKSDFISCFDNWKKRWNSSSIQMGQLSIIPGPRGGPQTLGSVTELRRSRRLQGREPILQPLPQRIEMEDGHRPTVSGSYLPCQRQRNPSTFSGDGNINPGQWLKEYEGVSKYNRWDETMKLANVVFYLNGTAGRWFDNNEESLNSWRSFEDAFRGVFGLQEDSARRAEEVLKPRAQKAEESSESYIQ
ncbi:hypothetical protein LAZ67_1000343 [Cordylochernes scorpioides]|uniref:Mos1 transposase HTH domain-containing protein n=1 Tax=Cordylochernes scorpioides TaxID=51811 RepID=A0ABY6JUN4_9ARAC|nr:hypothetical protein LAZ67_1000343 [Cordylochernes scorpioides]